MPLYEGRTLQEALRKSLGRELKRLTVKCTCSGNTDETKSKASCRELVQRVRNLNCERNELNRRIVTAERQLELQKLQLAQARAELRDRTAEYAQAQVQSRVKRPDVTDAAQGILLADAKRRYEEARKRVEGIEAGMRYLEANLERDRDRIKELERNYARAYKDAEDARQSGACDHVESEYWCG